MSVERGIIWDRPLRATRGPAPAMTREAITTAAIKLADAQGIEALSMRTLAVELGVGAASLYRYVDRKDELIELMVDEVMGTDLHIKVHGDWRKDLRGFARALRKMIIRHPWMAIEGAGRTSLGPNTAQAFELMLTAVDGYGLDIDEMLMMIETLDAFVRGRSLEEISDQEAARRSGLDNDEWMKTQEPYVRGLVESGRYPLLSRVILDASTPHRPDRLEHAFDAGLERVLDGFAAMFSG